MSQSDPARRQDPRRPLSRRGFVQAAGALGAGLLGGALANGQQQAQSPGDRVPLAPPGKQPPDLDVPQRIDRKAGWAVVGLGKLALDEIMPAFAKCYQSRPAALVSGHPDKARQVAGVYGIGDHHLYTYDTYDKLKDDEAVDVVYVVLPNSMHAEYTIRALEAGKHVLCEKPMATNAAECRRMIDAAEANGKKLMIAYRLHYEPYNQTVMQMCQGEQFGRVRTIASGNSQNVEAPNIRLSRKLGGGPVGDVGVYSINACRYITGREPLEVTAIAHRPDDDPRFREVPESVAYTLRFPGGVLAHCGCAFSTAESRFYKVQCTDGVVEMDPAFSYNGLRLFTQKGDERVEHRLEQVNHFAREMDHFSQCVLYDQTPWTPGEDGLRDQLVIDAIIESYDNGGRPVRVGQV